MNKSFFAPSLQFAKLVSFTSNVATVSMHHSWEDAGPRLLVANQQLHDANQAWKPSSGSLAT
tara:strand:- start:348 stop:533 length:186 start_codon:yes stop_codon:yes gene_type:complete